MLVSTGKRNRNTQLIIKICGICNQNDLQNVVQAGANAIGFMMFTGSKRHISLSRATSLRKMLPANVLAVAVMVNPDASEVEQIIEQLQPDILQFHGEEDEEFCASFAVPYIKALRAPAVVDDTASITKRIAQQIANYSSADFIMLDSYDGSLDGNLEGSLDGRLDGSLDGSLDGNLEGKKQGNFGGSGKKFNWELIPQDLDRPLIIAGGLNSQNVATLIKQVNPQGVDVSSGVEDAPGVKNKEKMVSFVNACRSA